MITASLNDYRQSPRKVRLVANLIKGKTADQAVTLLTFTVKVAAGPLKNLLLSALANAKHNFNIDGTNLYVKELLVNPGVVLKRSMPRARGSAYPIRKRTSHVHLTLAVREPKAAKANKATKTKTVKETK
jgi:large subunit ribosomal protein L22